MCVCVCVCVCLTSADSLALQHHAVEDEADVFGGRGGARALLAQQVQDLGGQHRVLAVLDELAQVGQARLLALRVLLDDADDAVHDGPLVIKTTLEGPEGNLKFCYLNKVSSYHFHAFRFYLYTNITK